jgi:hypothetical protein
MEAYYANLARTPYGPPGPKFARVFTVFTWGLGACEWRSAALIEGWRDGAIGTDDDEEEMMMRGLKDRGTCGTRFGTHNILVSKRRDTASQNGP